MLCVRDSLSMESLRYRGVGFLPRRDIQMVNGTRLALYKEFALRILQLFLPTNNGSALRTSIVRVCNALRDARRHMQRKSEEDRLPVPLMDTNMNEKNATVKKIVSRVTIIRSLRNSIRFTTSITSYRDNIYRAFPGVYKVRLKAYNTVYMYILRWFLVEITMPGEECAAVLYREL